MVLATAVAQGPGPSRGGVYTARIGETIIAREQYRFDGSMLAADVDLVSAGLHLKTETRYDAAHTPAAFHVAASRGGEATPFQVLDVTFGDSARWVSMAGGAKQSGATALTPPYGVLQNLQFSHVALALLRYDRARGGTQTLNLWLPQGAAVVPFGMSLVGDTGTAEVGGAAMHLTLDASGWLIKAAVPSQSLVVEWQASGTPAPTQPRAGSADTVAPAGAVESSFAVPSTAVVLSGTLTLPRAPAGRIAVAIIVAGSGPTDRDANSLLGIRPNTYAQLAWRLAERGIASWRYDKRGLPASRGTFNYAETTFDDFAVDVVAAAKMLAADPRFSRVVVLGHSEGAGLGVRAANGGAPVAGIALLSGMGRPFATVLHEQLSASFDQATLTRFDSAFARYLRGEEPGDLPEGLKALVAPVNRRFTHTAVMYDPAREIARVRVPVLIVQGTTDVQVSVADARALAAAKPDALLVLVPDANHTYKHAASKDRASQVAQYLDPTLPIVPQLVDAIVSWVGRLH